MTGAIHRYVEGKDLSTMRIGGTLRAVDIRTPDDVPEARALAQRLGLAFVPIGGGSNIVFPDGNTPILVGLMHIQGIEAVLQSDGSTIVRCGAGVDWDEVVDFAVRHGLSGIECLSLIPGSAGAAPVQNIGAYGAELCDAFESADAYDTADGRFVTLDREACRFGYRDSVFKKEAGRYVVTGVSLRLSSGAPKPPTYPDLIKWFAERSIATPNLAEIRDAVISIRTTKLPDPAVIANCGSFFKNPIIEGTVAAQLAERFPGMPQYPQSDGRVKLSAGWMIERVGLKGATRGAVGTHDRHALVIINRGNATRAELDTFVAEVIAAVKNEFDLRLEPEVNLI
jgi:UDP-N-acetylmuramate dehydrogenase